MNAAALAMLQDLARSRKMLKRGKGKGLSVRPLKRPASGGPRSKVLMNMDGLGHADPAQLIRQAELACQFLKAGHRAIGQVRKAGKGGKLIREANEAYFKAAAIASNVCFSASVCDVPLPPQVVSDMQRVISEGTRGIKLVMMMVAVRRVRSHERKMHGSRRSKK